MLSLDRPRSAAALPSITPAKIAAAEDPRSRKSGIDEMNLIPVAEGKASSLLDQRAQYFRTLALAYDFAIPAQAFPTQLLYYL